MKKFICKSFLIVVISLFTISCSKSDLTNNQTPNGTITDIDGNVYHSVKIGTQTWMVENLRVTHYQNGNHINNVTGSDWTTLDTGAYCWFNNDDDETNIASRGALYNGYAVKDSRKIAPAGWHVPSDAEWKTLIKYVDANADLTIDIGSQSVSDVAGIKLKEAGTAHWDTPNNNATNETGFTAVPGGRRGNWGLGGFDGNSNVASFFSTTGDVAEPNNLWGYDIVDVVYLNSIPMTWGLSVRCVKD